MRKDVLWSGGLDSTYLIYKLLKEGHHVDAHYIKIANNKEKSKRELASIQKLNKLFKNYDFSYKGIPQEVTVNNHGSQLFFYQSPVWILAASFLDGPVSIGYTCGDEAISYLDDYRKIARAYNAIRSDPLILEFPLSKIPKRVIWDILPKEYRDLVTWCESPENVQNCGECKPCLRMKNLIDK